MCQQWFVIVLLGLLSFSCNKHPLHLNIRDAEASISAFAQDSLTLDGEWLFLPGEFLNPDSLRPDTWPALKQKGLKAPIPGPWNEISDPANPGQTLPVFGFGSYVLRIQGLQKIPSPAFKIPGMLTASEVYFKGENEEKATLISRLGVVGKSAQEFVPFESKALVPFLPRVDAASYLIVHISNFQFRKSGMNLPIEVGSYADLYRAQSVSYGLTMWLIGMMLMIAIYNFFLFATRREDMSSLSLGIFALLIVSRMSTTENLVEYWVNRPSWLLTELRYKIEYLGIVLFPGAISVFFHLSFPKNFSKNYIRISMVLAFLQSLPVIFFSSKYFTPHLVLFQLVLIGSGLFATWCGLKVIWQKNPEWQYLLLGGIPFSIAIFVDVMVAREMIAIDYTTQYVTVWFTLTQSHILGKRFAKAFRTAQHLTGHLQQEVEQQTHEIAVQTRSMKAILDNVPVGVFTLSDQSLRIDQEYSQHMEKIFGTSAIAGQHLVEFLLKGTFLDDNEIDQTEQILNTVLQEAELNFALNERGLFRELVKTIDGTEKILSISWVPIVDHDIVKKLLVTVHDISELRNLAQKSQEHSDHLNRISEILQIGKDRMQNFFLSTRRMLENCLILSQPQVSLDVLKELFINIHTIKGNGRQLHLRQLTDSAHHCEKLLSELRAKPSLWHKPTMDEYLEGLLTILLRYEDQMNALQFHNRLEDLVKISRRRISPLVQNYQRQDSLSKEEMLVIFHYVASTLGLDLRDILDDSLAHINTLARDLGKEEPQLKIQCPELILAQEAREYLQNILIHVIRNSMDHGLETARERLLAGKPKQGTIQIRSEWQHDSLQIYFADDGRGLNINQLRRSLNKPQATAQHIAECIFENGVSTASAVTEISGRGVGMAAIKTYIEKAGGEVKLQLGPLDEKGFCPFAIRFTVPSSLVLWTVESSARIHPVAS